MSIEKHGRGVEQAWRMLDGFAQFGVARFDVTWTDLDGHKRGYRGGQTIDEVRRWMPQMLKWAIERQHNLIVRPQGGRAELVQLDDLRGPGLERVRKAAFLILTTSVGNHQAWVAVREGGPDLARRLRQGTGADGSASGAARVAGSVNFKRRYVPEFPTVEILEARVGQMVTGGELEAAGLVAAREIPVVRCRVSGGGRWRAQGWPSYERCIQKAPPAHGSERPDVSRADFTFCLLAIDWGWSVEETSERLLEKSRKAQENGAGYAWRTAQRAAAAVDRRSERSPEHAAAERERPQGVTGNGVFPLMER